MGDNAVQEAIKGMGRSYDLACKLIENVLDVPTKRFGDLLGDIVSHWQWRNRLKIADRARQILLSRGINPRALPPDFVVPFLRESGDASDESLQEAWAELLASAVDDDTFAGVAFVNTLHSMSPADIRFLNALLETRHVGREGRVEAVVGATCLTEKQAVMSLHNLERLGFFTPTRKRLKGFAIDFLQACSPNRALVDEFRRKEDELPRAVVMD